MPSWLPSIPYPPPDQPGYWQPVTSTLQWCEEDYYFTYYSAEIINTVTNAMFIYLAYKGVSNCRKNDHDLVFKVTFYGYFLVGFGSWMFHSTLKYPWQLVDELNMIYTTCVMCWASLSHSRSMTTHWVLGVFFTGLCAGITLYYHMLQDPLFHQNVYAALTTFVLTRAMFMQEMYLRPWWRRSTEKHRVAKEKKGLPVLSREQQAFENERDLKILKNMWILVVYGITIFLSGFALWGLDNKYCSTLRSWRRDLGMPWGFFLELHGWWHLLTGIGAYIYIVWGIWLRHILNGKHDMYKLVWPSVFVLPEIVKVENVSGAASASASAAVNGKIPNGGVKHR